MLAEESVGEAELSLVVIVSAAVPGEELVPAGGLRPRSATVAPAEHVTDVSKESAKHLSVIHFINQVSMTQLLLLLQSITYIQCYS